MTKRLSAQTYEALVKPGHRRGSDAPGDARARRRGVAAASLAACALMLAGCADLWPSLTGEDPSGNGTEVTIEPSPGEAAGDPVFGQSATTVSAFEPSAQPLAGQTGTFVGAKVAQQRAELGALNATIRSRQIDLETFRNTARQNSQNYFATVAAINARLRIGTTPGNPVLVSQWNAAQSELDRLLTDIASLNTLGNHTASDSAMASYLLESVRATYSLQGAVDEDHRQLAAIEDEVNRSMVLIDRLLGDIQGTIGRYTEYVNAERRNLTSLSLAIKNGEYVGPSLSNRGIERASLQGEAAQREPTPPLEPGIALADRRPLVVIRFDRPDVEYRQALYAAVSTALERRPSSMFDLVAVAPNQGSPADVALGSSAAKRNANAVLQSLTEMGLPSSRVTLSATTSTSARTNEVHIYVR